MIKRISQVLSEKSTSAPYFMHYSEPQPLWYPFSSPSFCAEGRQSCQGRRALWVYFSDAQEEPVGPHYIYDSEHSLLILVNRQTTR
ncbi:hypothetical protein BDZ89DRAFT_1079209 [Hymenopellis radicata]|nr:hypothetical protein BDZ89DRAFT_1079209 [Hymenopellis radicata]